MAEEMIMLILFGILVVLLAMGLEIGVSIGLIAIIGLVVVINQPVMQVAISAYDLMDSFVLTAVPLFIFMGAIFVKSGITVYLFDGVDAWIGRLPGGLAVSVVGSCAIFAAMSGSSLATCATMGTISLPEMERYHYDPKLSLGVVAAGGTLGILIPPSINLIVFGAWTVTSVVDLFAAGMIPGLILASLFAIMIMIRVMLNPSLAPKTPGVTWAKRLKLSAGILPWIVTIILVLGVIFTGTMTPTEAASLGAVIALVLALLYRRMSFKILEDALLMSVRICAMIFLIAGAAVALTYTITYTGVGQLVVAALVGLPIGKYGVLALIVVMYIILGMFIDPIGMMLLTIPFIAPVIIALGYNLVWFGVFLIVLLEMAFLTPPVGMNLFVVQSIAPKYSVMTIARGAIPFLIPMLIVLALLAIWPNIALWLPSMLR